MEELAFKMAAAFAPEDIPTSNPSSLANLLTMSIASWVVTVTISSICDLSNISGINPGPMPWMLWNAGSPPTSDNTQAHLLSFTFSLCGISERRANINIVVIYVTWNYCTFSWFNTYQLYGWILHLEIPPYACHCASWTRCSYKYIHFACCIFPYFRSWEQNFSSVNISGQICYLQVVVETRELADCMEAWPYKRQQNLIISKHLLYEWHCLTNFNNLSFMRGFHIVIHNLQDHSKSNCLVTTIIS